MISDGCFFHVHGPVYENLLARQIAIVWISAPSRDIYTVSLCLDISIIVRREVIEFIIHSRYFDDF